MARARLGALAAALALVATAAAGCGTDGADGDVDPVATSALEAGEVATPPGPAYLTQSLAPRPRWDVVVAGRPATSLGTPDVVDWLPDGRLLVQRGLYAAKPRWQVVDPVSGRVLHEIGLPQADPEAASGQVLAGVTPEAVTLLAGHRISVYPPDLTRPRTLEVGPSAVDTDQLDSPEASFELGGPAYTLGGVTWVQWYVNSEDDTRTDHGVLRIEDGAPTEVLRNEPVVKLLPSRDGAALLVLLQDDGEDEDCGGCVVEQRLVELDTTTGEVAADYGVPEGYTRDWRVEAVDKVGGTVVVRFAIGEAETREDPGVTRQTWTYDGTWEHLADLDGTRTRWQDGGRLTWTQTDTRRDVGEGARFRLVWTPDRGAEQEVTDGSDCPTNSDGEMAVPRDASLCPLVSAPGSLLPPD